VIDPFHRKVWTILVRTSEASFALLAVFKISFPQHVLTCFRIFEVECASFVSR